MGGGGGGEKANQYLEQKKKGWQKQKPKRFGEGVGWGGLNTTG